MKYDIFKNKLAQLKENKDRILKQMQKVQSAIRDHEKECYLLVNSETFPDLPDFISVSAKQIYVNNDKYRQTRLGDSLPFSGDQLLSLFEFITSSSEKQNFGHVFYDAEKAGQVIFSGHDWNLIIGRCRRTETVDKNGAFEIVVQIKVDIPGEYHLMSNIAFALRSDSLSGHDKIMFFRLQQHIDNLYKEHGLSC